MPMIGHTLNYYSYSLMQQSQINEQFWPPVFVNSTPIKRTQSFAAHKIRADNGMQMLTGCQRAVVLCRRVNYEHQ